MYSTGIASKMSSNMSVVNRATLARIAPAVLAAIAQYAQGLHITTHCHSYDSVLLVDLAIKSCTVVALKSYS